MRILKNVEIKEDVNTILKGSDFDQLQINSFNKILNFTEKLQLITAVAFDKGLRTNLSAPDGQNWLFVIEKATETYLSRPQKYRVLSKRATEYYELLKELN